MSKKADIISILSIGFEPLLTEEEHYLYKMAGEMKRQAYTLENKKKILDHVCNFQGNDAWIEQIKANYDEKIAKYAACQADIEVKFRELLVKNKQTRRQLTEFSGMPEVQYRKIALFENNLTRAIKAKNLEFCPEILTVITYYTEIFDNIIHNGFYIGDKKYIFFTAGAGQTRKKKSTFISEDVLNDVYNHLFCGLTKEKINELGGMNTNKFLAYTSLCQTGSELWEGFNIDRAIVVPDIEFDIPDQMVRYIYVETQEDKDRLLEWEKEKNDLIEYIKMCKNDRMKGERRTDGELEAIKELGAVKQKIRDQVAKYHRTELQKMSVTIPFTDGFGVSLKKMNTSMIRMPFMKGLEAYCPKKKFIELCKKLGIKINKIMDIYGKEHNIKDIDFIFTESQFKMHKYFENVYDSEGNLLKTGWEVYKDNFKKYECEACVCNVEPNNLKLGAKTNYQILQTLTTEMTDEEIISLARYDIETLNGVGRNEQCMLNLLGANINRDTDMNWYQQSLNVYPEMLKDVYSKNKLKNTKESKLRKIRSGRFSINGQYTFCIPDPLACLQWWFTGERDLDKLGFIPEGYVCCNMFKDGEEVDCLRSPHLDHAHCIRKNINNGNTAVWVKSKGIYVGVKDTMSKFLMFDNDGDKLLVHNNKTIIDCAKRFQEKYGMYPSYYQMAKARPEMLTDDNLFAGITNAYHNGNIGTPSNEITKVFFTLDLHSTREEVERAIEVVALRCADVNFTIDYAKTLYKPMVPDEIKKEYKQYSQYKVPAFFEYAKGKKRWQVEERGTGNIDRISTLVRADRIYFQELKGRYDYHMLMTDDVDLKDEAAQKIIALHDLYDGRNKREQIKVYAAENDSDDRKDFEARMIFDHRSQRLEFLKIAEESYVVNVLVKYLHNDTLKDTLWSVFGDVLYTNLINNLEGTKRCEECGERFVTTGNNSKYCEPCQKKREVNRVMEYKKTKKKVAKKPKIMKRVTKKK